MNAASNFSGILDRSPTEIDRPKPLPAGSYICVVKGMPEYGESAQKKTPYVRFILQPIQAQDDVDQEDLTAMGGFANKTIRATYYLTEDSVYRLDEFHEHAGLELSEETSRRQRNEQMTGLQVGAVLKHTASQDGTATYAELARTFAVE